MFCCIYRPSADKQYEMSYLSQAVVNNKTSVNLLSYYCAMAQYNTFKFYKFSNEGEHALSWSIAAITCFQSECFEHEKSRNINGVSETCKHLPCPQI